MDIKSELKGIKGDQLTLIAILTENLDKEELERVKAPWKRICDRLSSLEEANTRRTNIMNLLKDALEQLRLDVKYLQFDLEATRRERDKLQRKFDDKH